MDPVRVLHVLSAWVAPTALDAETVRRCSAARKQWNAGGYDVIVVSGGIFRAGQVCSAGDMMADWFSRVGIPSERVLVEGASVDTFENVAETATLLKRRFPNRSFRIDVVSNPLHSVRAFVTYRRHLGRFVRPRPVWHWTSMRQIVLEIILISLAATFDPHVRLLAGVRRQRRHAPN